MIEEGLKKHQPNAVVEIAPEWIERVRGSLFLYPCAGTDTAYAIAAFCGVCDPLVFVDRRNPREIRLPDGAVSEPVAPGRRPAWQPVGKDNRPPPRIARDVMMPGDRRSRVVFNVFDAEAFVRAMPDRSIGTFMHVGDNPDGEGGSGLHFLSSTIDPRGTVALINVLLTKLQDRALVVSDGSMSGLAGFRYSRHFSADDAVRTAGFEYRPVGHLRTRLGSAVVFGFERISTDKGVK